MAKKSKKEELRKGFLSYFSQETPEEVAEEQLEELEVVEESPVEEENVNTVADIPVDAIQVNPRQPRREFEEESLAELAESLQTHGLIQPITVRKMPDGQYQLISGERRLRASKMAKLESIPAYIRETADHEMHILALIENIQREDLNPIEIAISLTLLKEELHLETDEQVAQKVGKSRSAVTNYQRLLNLPPEIIKAVKNRSISFGHARALAGLKNIDTQLVVFNELMDKELSVRELESLVHQYKPKKKNAAKDIIRNQHYPTLREQLTKFFGLKTDVQALDGEKGKISMVFKNDDLDRLLDLLES